MSSLPDFVFSMDSSKRVQAQTLEYGDMFQVTM
jgi:hypothetical protein